MKIGIISAVAEEIKTIHENINFDSKIKYVERSFYFGKYNEIELVLVYSNVGKVSASITASILIEKFGVEQIIFTGLAGAVSNKLNRGDIVLCNATYQYDVDARPLCENQFEIAPTGRILFKLPKYQVDIADKAISKFLNHLDQYVDIEELKRLKVTIPKKYVGVIATGDKFVENATNHKELFVEGIDVLAVEMEGAAVAQVCTEYKIPYTLIRIISDNADNNALESLKDFSVKLASHYSSGIIQEILKLLN